jgi:hypothetical protein
VSDDWTQEQLQDHAFQKMLAAPAMSDDADVKALIAEARAVVRDDRSYNFVPEPRLLLDLADALEAVSARPLVADEQRVLDELLTGDYYRAADQGDSVMLIGAVLEAARNAGALMADREAVQSVIDNTLARRENWEMESGAGLTLGATSRITNALFASGVIQSKGDAQAEALEEVAGRIEASRYGLPLPVSQITSILRARAAAYRTPSSSTERN